MYTEFIIIYIGVGISVLLSIVSVVLLLKLLKRTGGSRYGNAGGFADKPQSYGTQSVKTGVVFCKYCGTRFDAATRVCPKCGTPR